MKKNKSTLIKSIFTIFLFIIAGIYYLNIDLKNTSTILPAGTTIPDAEFAIHYIDVGQADSILVVSGDNSMLIDAGNNKDGKNIVNYINDLGITKLDYVIGTHPHADHIGGLDDVINNLDTKKVLMPKVQTNTKTFEDVLDAIANKKLKITTVNVGDTYTLGDAEFQIVSVDNNAKDLNLSSIVIRLNYGDCSYIFCGDAEIPNEEVMLNSGLTLKSDIIKLGHHGSSTSSSKDFLEKINPSVAIISCGKDNDYGHPHKETIQTLEELNIPYYRTDKNGTIIIYSDGFNNSVYLTKGEGE